MLQRARDSGTPWPTAAPMNTFKNKKAAHEAHLP